MLRSTLIALLAACGPATPDVPVASPPTPLTRCQTALLALVDGRLDAWSGATRCTRPEVARVFGATGKPVPSTFGVAQLYAARGIAANDIEVTFASPQERIDSVALWDAKLAATAATALGPPELTLPSGLGANVSQRVWPSRGIVLHTRRDGTTALLVALPVMSAADFDASGIAVLPQAHEDRVPR